MRFKKRYLLLLVPVALIGVLKLELFAFRQSETKQAEFFKERGIGGASFHRYELDGRTMHYTHVGDPGLPLVILVHGSPGSSSAYMDYLADETLLSFAQVVSVDRPGFGYSDFGKAEPSLAEQARLIQEITHRHPAEKVILVGHSYGGPVIARMAMDYPASIEGIILVAGSVDPELEPREWWRKPLNWPVLRWALPTSMRVCNQEILPLYEELEAMLPAWKHITCQVSVVQGEKDRLVPAGNADFVERMAVNSKRMKINRIAGGDHFILWSRQSLIVEEIRTQLANKFIEN